MPKQLTLKEVLEEAIHKEIEAQQLYAGMGKTVTDETARDILAD